MTRPTLFQTVGLLVVGGLMCSLCACSRADLRTNAITQRGISHTQKRNGRDLIDTLSETHGGLQRWTQQQTMRASIVDTWPDWLTRAAAMPWASNPQTFQIDVLLTHDSGRITFLNGPQRDASWGIQHWVTYTATSSGAQPTTNIPDDIHEDITFWIPTLIYFLEAPFRLREATVVAHVGERVVDGRTLDGIFLSWGTAKPQEHVDQYIVWIDQETGLLAFLEYTVRDVASFVTGTMAYRDYKEFNGFWLPTTLTNVDGLGGDDTLHSMSIQSVTFNTPSPQELLPFPDQRGSKY